MTTAAVKWADAQRIGGRGGVGKTVLKAIAARAGEEGYCWPSVATLAADMEISPRCVRYWTAKLESLGYISKHSRYARDGDFTSNLYRLNLGMPPDGAPHGRSRRRPPPPSGIQMELFPAGAAGPEDCGFPVEGAAGGPLREPLYLAVPYVEKDDAKALGARWDSWKRAWYVPAGLDPAPFGRWTAGPKARLEAEAPAAAPLPAPEPLAAPEPEPETAPTAEPAPVPAPPALDFGVQPVDTVSPPQTVVFRNTGAAPQTLQYIAASGDFTVTPACVTPLLPGEACTLEVTFTPTATGRRTGRLTVIPTTGRVLVLPLSGTGAAPPAGPGPGGGQDRPKTQRSPPCENANSRSSPNRPPPSHSPKTIRQAGAIPTRQARPPTGPARTFPIAPMSTAIPGRRDGKRASGPPRTRTALRKSSTK